MKVLDIPKSGKRGKIVAFKSRFGQCERGKAKPTKRSTAAQFHAREDLGSVSPWLERHHGGAVESLGCARQ
jgi:hypothetical protein